MPVRARRQVQGHRTAAKDPEPPMTGAPTAGRRAAPLRAGAPPGLLGTLGVLQGRSGRTEEEMSWKGRGRVARSRRALRPAAAGK